MFEIALLGQDPAAVMARYQALEGAFERGNRIDAFMDKLAERRRREREGAAEG